MRPKSLSTTAEQRFLTLYAILATSQPHTLFCPNSLCYLSDFPATHPILSLLGLLCSMCVLSESLGDSSLCLTSWLPPSSSSTVLCPPAFFSWQTPALLFSLDQRSRLSIPLPITHCSALSLVTNQRKLGIIYYTTSTLKILQYSRLQKSASEYKEPRPSCNISLCFSESYQVRSNRSPTDFTETRKCLPSSALCLHMLTNGHANENQSPCHSALCMAYCVSCISLSCLLEASATGLASLASRTLTLLTRPPK